MNSIVPVEVKKSLGTIQDNLDAVEAPIGFPNLETWL